MYPPTEPDWNKLYSLDEALALDGEKLRHLTGEDHGPWVVPETFLPPDTATTLAHAARLLDGDAVAATIVAATINTRQAAGEAGPAFVKRIVRAWLSEMARQS